MKVAKWGNSLAVRLPAPVVEALDLKAGDDIQIEVRGERTLEAAKQPTRAELVERLKRFEGLLPPGFKFDRLEAYERD